MSDAPLISAGLALAAAGLFLLCETWRLRRSGQGAWRLWAGWTLLGLAVAPFCMASGVDRGAVAGLCVIMTLAYMTVGMRAELRKPRRKAKPAAAREDTVELESAPTRPLRLLLRILAAGPLAGAAAYAACLAVALHGPGTQIDRLATAAYLLPLVWGAAMAWAVADERLLRPSLGLTGVTSVALATSLLAGAQP